MGKPLKLNSHYDISTEGERTINKTESDQFLTVGIVARILRKSPDVIKRYEKSGKLQCIKTETGMRLFRRGDILQFARARQAKDQREPMIRRRARTGPCK